MKRLMVPALALLIAAPASAQLAPPNDAGVTMGHVHLNVSNVEAHRKLWVEHFGATPLAREGLPGVKLPGMLILFRQQAPAGGSEGTVLDHFGFKIPNLASFLERWRAAGYEVQREFKGTEGFPNAYVIGPDQLKIELQEDTALKVQALSYHLHYLVADHLKLIGWYVNTFSAFPRKRGEHDTADVPGMNLTIQTPRTPPAIGTRGRVIDHIGFEVKNLEAFCRKLETLGIKFDHAYRTVPSLGLGVAFLTDPFGTYIELTEGLDRY